MKPKRKFILLPSKPAQIADGIYECHFKDSEDPSFDLLDEVTLPMGQKLGEPWDEDLLDEETEV